MPLNRSLLQAGLEGAMSNSDHLSGIKLALVLANYSKGVLPPTLGVFTGIMPAAAAYEAAAPFDGAKTIGIENAVNAFAQQNAIGMSTISAGLFTGIAPPPLRNTQILYDFVRDNNLTKAHLCKTLSIAIHINWTLGKSIFNPLPFTIPTWNIPILPFAVRKALQEEDQDLNEIITKNKAKYQSQIDDTKAGLDGILGTADDTDARGLLDYPSFFERSNEDGFID
jgi:hypothetical protein